MRREDGTVVSEAVTVTGRQSMKAAKSGDRSMAAFGCGVVADGCVLLSSGDRDSQAHT